MHSISHPLSHPGPAALRLASALQVLDKALVDEAAKGAHKEMRVRKLELLGRMGWAHLQRGEEEAMKVRFPKGFQPW